MRRGLKLLGNLALDAYYPGASNRSPMRRGLKPYSGLGARRILPRFKPIPDEEGTETVLILRLPWAPLLTASNRSPMRRGLKPHLGNPPLIVAALLQTDPR